MQNCEFLFKGIIILLSYQGTLNIICTATNNTWINKQFSVPRGLRHPVMELSHESTLSVNLDITKTHDRTNTSLWLDSNLTLNLKLLYVMCNLWKVRHQRTRGNTIVLRSAQELMEVAEKIPTLHPSWRWCLVDWRKQETSFCFNTTYFCQRFAGFSSKTEPPFWTNIAWILHESSVQHYTLICYTSDENK